MSEPIEFRAVLDLQEALQAISVVGGYFHDVADTAVKLNPESAAEALVNPSFARPFILLQLDPGRWEYLPGNQLRRVLVVLIHWVSESTPSDDTSRMRAFFRGCADVETAINVDLSRGGRTVDTRITKQLFDTAVEGSRVWAQIEVEMPMHRNYGQPNE